MKLLFWLAGGVTLLFAWLALRAPGDDGVPAAVLKTAALPQAAVVAPAAPPVPAGPSGIRVHGVLFRGSADAASQALLSVQGGTAQVFRVGEPVAQGWSLAGVAPDHVVLASGGTRARLDVTYSVSAPADPVAAAKAPQAIAASLPAASAAAEQRLPGFVVTAQPIQAARTPANLAANQRFLQDRATKSRQAP